MTLQIQTFELDNTIDPTVINYMLFVNVAAGLEVRDQARPQSLGSRQLYAVPVSTVLRCYVVLPSNGALWGHIVSLKQPGRIEWVRIGDANMDYALIYRVHLPSVVSVEQLLAQQNQYLARIATSLEKIAGK